ncbi:MAG TPA: DNA alkylation repair protein [Bryobacteraceae bacterium]|nr:DNA alkylation repair protein [Bryobacteraceae bacterium]
MDKVTTLRNEIRKYCAAHADAAQAGRYARYFTEGYDAWGLMGNKHALWTEMEPEWIERYGGIGLLGFLKLGEMLFRDSKYEEGALAIRFVKHFRDEIDDKALDGLAKWFAAGIANWAHTDVLCGEILAPLLEGGQTELHALASWREAQYKYQRRAVPVAMLGLLKTKTSARPLLEFLRPLMMDAEKVVQQGLGWFLRETWKKQPKPVEAFLLEWKDRAPRVIYQYATEKMTPDARARFRRARK